MIKTFKLLIPAFCGLLSIVGCTHKVSETRDDKFKITDSLINSLVVDTVKSESALSEITLSGKIMPDDSRTVKIYPMVSGIAQDVHVQLGDIVHKGQLLATMRSSEVAGFSKDLIAAGADLMTSRRALQVAQDLYKSGLASHTDLETAQGEYDKAVAENRRAGEVMKINVSNSRNAYLVKAPADGFVVEKNITDNTQVRTDNNQVLFTITDLSTVWAMINIYESDIAGIKTGDDVNITTLSYPDKVFTGKIDKIYDMVDPDNKVISARVMIRNPGYLLKPEMFASIRIRARNGEKLPEVSTRSLIFDNDRNYVLVVQGPSSVKIIPVQVAKKIEDRAYISSGIKVGDRIIASRQVFLYESLKN